ncbi:MAG: caspase family protein [Bacteroidota bacterium]
MPDRSIKLENGPIPETLTIGNTYFLGIGINAYRNFIPLNNAVKDVTDVGNLLTTYFGFSDQKPYFDLKTNGNATRRNIIKAVNELCKIVKREDRVLIYYSGHGYLDDVTEYGYWIPVDAENGFLADYVSNADIQNQIKRMPCRHILLISDSCFSGSLLYREVTKRPADNRAFYDWERKASRWVVTSGKGVVSDGKAGKNSPFAEQLLRHLKEVGDKVNISTLADKVTTTISYNDKQQPEACPLFGAGHEGGQFIFYRNGSGPNIIAPEKIQQNNSNRAGSKETEAPQTASNATDTTTKPSTIPPKEAPTNLVELKKQLKDLIEEDELKPAFSLLKEYLVENSSLTDDLILLASRFNSTSKDRRLGLVSRNDARREFAQIKYALKDYVNDMDNSDVHFTAPIPPKVISLGDSIGSLDDLEREGLLDEAKYLQKRINRLKKALTMETDANRIFAYEEQVEELTEKLAEVKRKLG